MPPKRTTWDGPTDPDEIQLCWNRARVFAKLRGWHDPDDFAQHCATVCFKGQIWWAWRKYLYLVGVGSTFNLNAMAMREAKHISLEEWGDENYTIV